jgi:hypothetical protein
MSVVKAQLLSSSPKQNLSNWELKTNNRPCAIFSGKCGFCIKVKNRISGSVNMSNIETVLKHLYTFVSTLSKAHTHQVSQWDSKSLQIKRKMFRMDLFTKNVWPSSFVFDATQNTKKKIRWHDKGC